MRSNEVFNRSHRINRHRINLISAIDVHKILSDGNVSQSTKNPTEFVAFQTNVSESTKALESTRDPTEFVTFQTGRFLILTVVYRQYFINKAHITLEDVRSKKRP